jgi:hypothetical protein
VMQGVDMRSSNLRFCWFESSHADHPLVAQSEEAAGLNPASVSVRI